MPLNRAEVLHLAALVRVGLDPSEVEQLREQLSSVLAQFETLQELDTRDVPPTGHAVALQTVLREDEPAESLPPEAVLSNAPNREGDQFRVKAVLGE